MVDAAGEASEPPRAATAASPTRGGLHVLAALGALAALVAVVSVVGSMGYERQRAAAHAVSQGSWHVERLARDVEVVLRVAEVALDRLDSKLDSAPAGKAAEENVRLALVDMGPLLATLPLPATIRALDADGRVLGHPLPGAAGLPPLDGPGWHVGTARGEQGTRFVPLWRRAAPTRQGVAAWQVELDHAALLRHLDASRSSNAAGAALFRIEADGSTTLLARVPYDPAELGQRLRGPLAAGLARAPKGSFSGVTLLDQVDRTVTYQRLGGGASTLVVAYGMTNSALLAGWRTLLPWAAAAALLLLAAIGSGAYALDRMLRAQAKQALAVARSESQFRTLAGNLPDAVVRLDRDGRHLYANPAASQFTGLAPMALIGRTPTELGMPALGMAAWLGAVRRVFDGGGIERVEFAYPGPQGPCHWESLIASEPAVPGAPSSVLVISRDVSDRKRAAAESEGFSRRMVDLLDTISDGFVSLDRDWRYLAVNRKAGEFLGRDAGQLIGKHIWTEFPEGVGQPFQRAYERAMNEGLPAVIEEYYAPWDKWFENRIHPSPDGISIFFTDITTRVKVTQALRESEARHREMFESNPHPMWVYDVDSLAFLDVNDAAVVRYGYTREEFLRMNLQDIRPHEELPRLLQSIAQPAKFVAHAETWRHRTKDGRLLEVEITAHTMSFEGRPAKLVLAYDVTRRNQIERALRDNEERLRLALQAARQGMYDLDVRTGQAVVSPEYALMLGWQPEEFHETVTLWRERLHPDDREHVYGVYDDYVAGRSSDYRMEFRQRTKLGGWKWILSVGAVQERDADGRPLRMLGTHTDITATKEVQIALADSEARYRDLFEHNPAPMVVIDRSSLRLLAVNDAFVEQYGYGPDEALSLALSDLWPAPDRNAAALALTAKTGLAADGEWRHQRRDGSALTVDVRSHELAYQGRPARIAVLADITERRRAESERRAAAERFEILFQSAPEAISLSDLVSGRFLQVNAAFGELFGHSREETIGRTALEMGLWTEPEGRDTLVRRLRAGESVRGFEGIGRQRSGALIDVQFSAEMVNFDDADCLLLMFRDITQRKAAEAALRHSEQRFRLAAASGQVWEWDFGAGGVSAPNELFSTLGLPQVTPDRVLAAFEAAVHPDDWLEMRNAVKRHLQGRGPYRLEFRARDAQGRIRWFATQGQALFDDRGRAIYMAGTTFEVTERREAEEQVRQLASELERRVAERTEQLARSESRYRTIFETVPVSIAEEDWSDVQSILRDLRDQGVARIDVHLASRPDFVQRCQQAIKRRRMNHKALELAGAADAATGVGDLEFAAAGPEDLQHFVSVLEALWSGQRVIGAKRSLSTPSGEPLSLMLTMSLPGLDDDDGTVLSCLVDITEIDRLNAELDRSVARLRQANQELETFTYSVSHDLKAPLRGIDGYSRLLLSDHGTRLDDEGREFLTRIRQATQHMGALIDDLLAYSRLDRRDLTMASQPLAALVDAALTAYRQEFAAAGVQLVLRVDPTLRVQADAQGLTMALRNLVDNAFKFSRNAVPQRIWIEARRCGPGVQLSVRDNGVGFDMKFHDRIFSIFQRLHRAEEYSGTGIGLAIVHKAMHRMGGQVSARSQPGQGATFTLELPEDAAP